MDLVRLIVVDFKIWKMSILICSRLPAESLAYTLHCPLLGLAFFWGIMLYNVCKGRHVLSVEDGDVHFSPLLRVCFSF